MLPGGARMPGRSVRARRALRRRELRHRPGLRAGRDADPRRPLQPGLARGPCSDGSTRRERRRRPACASPRPTTTGSTPPGITPCWGSSTSPSRISRAPAGTWRLPWPGWTGCIRQSPGSSRACRTSWRRSSAWGGSARRNGTSAVSRSRPRRSIASGAGDGAAVPSAYCRCRRRSRRRATRRRGIGRAARRLRPAVRDRAIAAGPRSDPSAGQAKASREGVPGPGRGRLPWPGREALGGSGQRGARADRRSTVDPVRAHRGRAKRRLARRPRVHQPGGRRRAVHQREHRPGEPQAHLPQARRSITDGAGGEDRSAPGGLIRRRRRIKRTRPGGSRGASRLQRPEWS